MKLLLSELASAMGAEAAPPWEAAGYSIDSRTIAATDLFFALRGEKQDGHAFVADVLATGAAAVVEPGYAGEGRLLRVPDVLVALQASARYARKKWGGKVIAVTGSAGKTTTKDIVAELLGTALRVGKTTGNFNNHIGLPLSLLRIPDDAAAAVIEIGMNHAGEIQTLAEIARPDIAVVTNVGTAHVENFSSGIDGVALAKRELVESLSPAGVAILNADDERVRTFGSVHPGRTVSFGTSAGADVRAVDVRLSDSGVSFGVDGVQFESGLLGLHGIRNILAGIAVAQVLGVEAATLVDAVAGLRPAKMRGQRFQHRGITIFDDCYNSNPDAAKTMLELLRDTTAQRRIAVLGEMLELGQWSEPLHRDVGSFAVRCRVDVLAGIRGVARSMVQSAIEQGLGEDAAFFFETPVEAGQWLQGVARTGDAILFKGSRGTHVEVALAKFMEQEA